MPTTTSKTAAPATEAAATSDETVDTRCSRKFRSATTACCATNKSHVRTVFSDSDSDSDVKLEEILSAVTSTSKPSASKKLLESSIQTSPRNGATKRSHAVAEFLTPENGPQRASKRRTMSGASPDFGTPSASQSDGLKPFMPSSSLESSMNASLVFDMVTSLSTNDPGVAIATLRSIVVLGKEYPSDLLYTELIDRIQSHEAVAYNDAVAIYAALVFVFDKASACRCAVTFPNQWEPLATALQEVSGNGRVREDGKPKKDESWRRNLLVVQFYIYCFQQDMHACRSRYTRVEGINWVHRTRLFLLLQGDSVTASSSAKACAKSRAKSVKQRNNKLIFLAIGWGLQLWKRVYDEDVRASKNDDDDEDGVKNLFLQHEGEQACLAVVRLIEMLYLCTDQQVNALQRILAGLAEFKRPTRIKFSQALQSPALRTQLATTMIGLSNKSRCKELEWYECNALGRVQLAMNSDTTSDVAHTDGYSWSHFDSFINLKPQTNLTKLLQEISRTQHH
uniref:Wings apart-like protein C-terminal domain-containing protein n=1 Tax=Peronospora matthiolae TaxID=2874970 RepID=A0AAV1TJP3_9STRA